ncbi:MAG: hypothetical protein H7A36_00225 [Chlamydiales bacterium]|nr:hypothetical protein [Chlamydiales bacterium]
MQKTHYLETIKAMANPPPTIAGPPPGVASSYTNGTEHLDPVHRAIYDLAQQYFANRTYPNSIGNAPSPWPYGPHPLLSAYPPAAQMGPYPYVVMPGPGLMLQTPFSFPWLPYGMPSFMPGPGQFPSAPPPGHYPPPAPLPGEPKDGDAQNTWMSNLRAIKTDAEKRVQEQIKNRNEIMENPVCRTCELNIKAKSLADFKRHADDNHDGVMRCWFHDCKRREFSSSCAYDHLITHNCGAMVYVCGDCAMKNDSSESSQQQKRTIIFPRLATLKDHFKNAKRCHPETPVHYSKVRVTLQEKPFSDDGGEVVYFFRENPSRAVRKLLSENYGDKSFTRFVSIEKK